MRLNLKSLVTPVVVIILVLSVSWLLKLFKQVARKSMKSYLMEEIYRSIPLHSLNEDAKSTLHPFLMIHLANESHTKLIVSYDVHFQCNDVEMRRKALTVSNFSCEGILFDNPTYGRSLNQAQTLMKERKSTNDTLQDDYFIELTQNCDLYRTTLGYRFLPLADEDEDFSIAFNILAHNYVFQFERLFRAIYRPQNSYCIHIDTKASEKFQLAVRGIAGCFHNVFVASKLESVVYAGYSRLQADINCMKDQLKSPIKWRYLLNTAVNEYPLKTNAEIVKILKIYNGANDIRAVGFAWTQNLKDRWDREWFERKEKDYVRLKRAHRKLPPPHNLTIVKGSAYGIFSRPFVDYLIKDKVAQDYLEWCRATYSPDEHYWNTLHHTFYNPHISPPGSYAGIAIIFLLCCYYINTKVNLIINCELSLVAS